MKEHGFLYLIWKDPMSRRNFTVGKLEKLASGYAFEYCNEYKEALENGWVFIQAFPKEKRYESEELFPAFSSRLPDRKRKNISDILKKYGLEEYDGYELLKQSGGRLPIDTYEFIDPIFDDDKTIEKEFFIVGVRHLSGCNGKSCAGRPELKEGMKLSLQREPTNEYDPFAILVMTEKKEPLGYIPRYYSQSICDRFSKGMTYDCIVLEISANEQCQQCVKVKLYMPKRNEW